MTKNELDLLAIYLDRAVKEEYFSKLENYKSWKDSLATGEVRAILNTLIGFMIPDLHLDIQEELFREQKIIGGGKYVLYI